jgi:hypothetical protein
MTERPRLHLAGRARLVIGIAVGLCASVALALPSAPAAGAPVAHAATHFACSGPHSATQPCRFSTPSGNIRCLWTPAPNRVECELLATKRAFKLGPSGHAHRVHVALSRRGETLPTSQQIVFPGSLSCHDTRRTMTCNQDFGLGAFTLVRGHSHAS